MCRIVDIWLLIISSTETELLWFGLTRPSVSLLQFGLDSPWSPHPACPAHPAGAGAGAGARGQCLSPESQAEISFPQGKKYYTFAHKSNHRIDFFKNIFFYYKIRMEAGERAIIENMFIVIK